jgi:hypothetical protein
LFKRYIEHVERAVNSTCANLAIPLLLAEQCYLEFSSPTAGHSWPLSLGSKRTKAHPSGNRDENLVGTDLLMTATPLVWKEFK